MIRSYLTDEIQVINLSVSTWGKITEDVPVITMARVFYKTKTIRKPNKEEVEAIAMIMLPLGIDIKNDSKIIVTKINGNTAPEPEKKYTVVSSGRGHGFSPGQSFIKVWIS